MWSFRVPSWPVVVASCLLGTPVAASADGTVSHTALYTRTLDDMAARATVARSALKLVDPKRLPPAWLMRENARPSGLGPPGALSDGAVDASSGIVSDASGAGSNLAIAPYTTAGAYAQYGGPNPTAAAVAVTSFPWRATGKLLFTIDGTEYVCSGAMIAPGLLLTAAHCVYEFGTNSAAGWHGNYVFYPGLADANLLGSWTALEEVIPKVYYAGTDDCMQFGVVCNNDIAIIVMKANAQGVLPGTRTSTYGYGWNGYSYVTSFGGAFLSHITELGYPQAFDSGLRMERTDGIGAVWSPGGGFRNTLLGTAQTGGSSGGPWIVNFGTRPRIDAENASLGATSTSNIVVGVTSWGYQSVGTNTQGSSWFGQNAQFPGTYTDTHGQYRGAGNIAALVAQACSAHFDHC